jgi:hypothetical protein
MTDLMEKALATVKNWPADQQNEAAAILLALDRLGPEPYVATAEELAAIDAALEQVEAGELATADEVASTFARFRR